MALELDDLKKKHDLAYEYSQVNRERASDDLVFYHVTQWDDGLISDSNILFKGQFDVLRKAGRQIMGDLATNPVQVDFTPMADNREDGAELLDGLYRADDRRNESIEAYGYASQDAVVCGFGVWLLYNKYETNQIGDMNQVIRRKYIPEACNTVFFDPNAKRQDKSDAEYVSILTSYTPEGYVALVKDLTGEEIDVDSAMTSFKSPEQSYAFPWIGGKNKEVYVTEFYHTEEVKDTVLTFEDPFGMEIMLLSSQLDDVMDELIDSGYTVVAEKEILRNQVTRYVASGNEILDTQVIAGQYIPAVPIYGERAIVEGQEHYEGITRLAKDPQRLRNFQMSYLADIVSTSPRPKPIFTPEQIQGFENMYNAPGADNNYPYLLQNYTDANSNPLPIGPVAVMPEQPIPQALAASIELTKSAVEDVANPGLPQDIADPDLSGKAVIALQNRMDQQSYIYQHNLKHAKRRDGEIYASMASEIYDAPRNVMIALPDGTVQNAEVMQTATDRETGETRVINDLTNLEFDVYSEIGPSYKSQKKESIDTMREMLANLSPEDPLFKMLTYKIIELMDGVEDKDIKDYIHKQQVLAGFRSPENEEEAMLLQQASEPAPDAAMLLAEAENKKGDAAIMKEQRELMKLQVDSQDNAVSNEIDAFDAETKRLKVQVDAQEAQASIENKEADTFNKRVDASQKVQEQYMKRLAEMTPQQLLEAANGAA